jgi:hypothetical protein
MDIGSFACGQREGALFPGRDGGGFVRVNVRRAQRVCQRLMTMSRTHTKGRVQIAKRARRTNMSARIMGRV